MKKVAVVGCSGAGKTTLGRELARRLDVPFVELDQLHHLAGWQERPAAEFKAAVTEAVGDGGWVVDGNYQSKLDGFVIGAADTVVWLDYDRPLVMRRVVRRTLRRVATREELWNGNREPWSNLWSRDPYNSIIAWTWTQHASYRNGYAAVLDDRWVRLRNPKETERWLRAVSPSGASS